MKKHPKDSGEAHVEVKVLHVRHNGQNWLPSHLLNTYHRFTACQIHGVTEQEEEQGSRYLLFTRVESLNVVEVSAEDAVKAMEVWTKYIKEVREDE